MKISWPTSIQRPKKSTIFGWGVKFGLLVFFSSVFATAKPVTTTEQYRTCVFSSKENEARALDKAYGSPAGRDIVFILDTSGSIGNKSLESSIWLIDSLVQYQLLRSGGSKTETGRVSLLSFDNTTTVHFDGTSSQESYACNVQKFQRKLYRVSLNGVGKTEVIDALKTAKNLVKKNSKPILWVFSDGEYKPRQEFPGKLKRELKTYFKNTEILVVGIGNYLDSATEEENLLTLADETGGHYLCVKQWQEVVDKKLKDASEDDLCNCRGNNRDVQQGCSCSRTTGGFEPDECLENGLSTAPLTFTRYSRQETTLVFFETNPVLLPAQWRW